jgi:predicted O-methyltransferase YrrM
MVDSSGPQFPKGMRPGEYEVLQELLSRFTPKRTLEIGLANGGSAVVLCKYHAEARANGRHTAIDPYQSAPPPLGFASFGVKAVQDAGYGDLFRLIEQPNFLGLPQLIVEKAKFDLVLIDGWHSFDYAFVDYFYVDLLLEVGGLMIFHDTGWPSVEKVCRFLEENKPYERLSPPTAVELDSLIARVSRRLGQVVTGTMAQARERRTRWFSLAAYRKQADHMVPEHEFKKF